ncbi:MAG: hypothetical protein KAW16_06580 [candidate division Zixibacteria bacterium]|nr:hypothetical protein [candidate division Zixibacteria bacterium]
MNLFDWLILLMSLFDWLVPLMTGVFVTCIGVVLHYRLWVRKEKRQRVIEHRKSQIKTLKAIRQEVKWNSTLVEEVKKYANTQHGFPYFNMDTSVWRTISKDVADLDNEGLRKLIARTYFEYEHFTRKVDLLVQSEFTTIYLAPVNLQQSFASRLKRLRQAIIAHPIDSKELVVKIDEELRKLQGDHL